MRVLTGAMWALLLAVENIASASAQPLTADNVARGYVQTVSIGRRDVAGLPSEDRSAVAEADASTRQFAHAAPGAPAWDVLSARGIVVISEPEPGWCEVLAYGPRVVPTFEAAATALHQPDLGFVERESPQTPELAESQ